METGDPLATARVPSGAPLDYYGLALRQRAPVESAIEPDIARAARALAQPGDRVLVGGGGVGSVSALLAWQLGNRSVWTIEPNPALVQSMRGNIALEGQALQIIEGALWSENGDRWMSVPAEWWNASLTRGGETSRRVQIFDVNEICQAHCISALVLDIEGAERHVISHLNLGPLRWLIVELHEADDLLPLTKLLLGTFSEVRCLRNHGDVGVLLQAARDSIVGSR